MEKETQDHFEKRMHLLKKCNLLNSYVASFLTELDAIGGTIELKALLGDDYIRLSWTLNLAAYQFTDLAKRYAKEEG